MTGLYSLKDGSVAEYKFNKDQKIILVGVPGAFTPTCTEEHLPGFVNNLDKLKDYTVVFFASNDCCVMDAWNKLYGHPDIAAASDNLGEFAKTLGEEVDFGPTFGWRCKRCAYLIEDGEVVKKFKSPFIDGVLSELND